MRRFITATLLALFIVQSSGLAMAAPRVDAVAPPLLAQFQLAFSQMLQSLAATEIGAFVLGRESQYQAMHAPAPDFQKAHAAAARVVPHRNFRRPTVMPVLRAGVLVRPRITNGRAFAMPVPPRPHSTVKYGALVHSLGLPRLHTASVKTMVAGPAAGSGTTGINRWWTYEQGKVPGVGQWMVNVGTGNLLVQERDVDIPERGIDLAFVRTYNSQSQHDYANTDGSVPDVYGNGWTSTTDAHIAFSNNGQIASIYDIDGARYDYTLNSDGTWTPPPGMQGTQLLM